MNSTGLPVFDGHEPGQPFLLEDEKPIEFETLVQSLNDWLLPEGPLETRLCRNLARCFWRQDRGGRLEQELIEAHRQSPKAKVARPAGPSALIASLNRDGHGPRIFSAIIRYNSQLSTEVQRTLHMLVSMQQGRLNQERDSDR